MSAVASLQSEIDSLTLKLEEVSSERDQLTSSSTSAPAAAAASAAHNNTSPLSHSSPDPTAANSWEMQCQRYEERIVELHSVIAELSRKLDDRQDGVIREESEFEEEEEDEINENRSIVSDSCPDDPLYEEEDEDYTSLAFERAIDRERAVLGAAGVENSSQGSKFSAERDYEAEIQALRDELLSAQREVQSANQLLGGKDKELAAREGELSQALYERDNYWRQLQDIKATMEFQEARMDSREKLQSPVGAGTNNAKPIGGRSSSERRSLRRRRHEKQPPPAAQSSEKVSDVVHYLCSL